VLTVENIDAVMPFYVDLLGFGLSDYIQKPFRAYFSTSTHGITASP